MLNQDLKVSDNLIHFLKNEEGFRDKAYQDSGGIWTIGYGNTTMGGKPVGPGMSIPKEQADVLMKEKLSQFSNTVKSSVKVPLSQNEFDALVSFTYNAGPNNFKKSTLLKRLNVGDKEGATKEFSRWIYDDKKQPVLKNRRAREAALFSKGGQDSSGGPVTAPAMADNTAIANTDTTGGPIIADNLKKKVVPTFSPDSGGGLPSNNLNAQTQIPSLMTAFGNAGKSPLEAAGDLNPLNLIFSPASAQSEASTLPELLPQAGQNQTLANPASDPTQLTTPAQPAPSPQTSTPGFNVPEVVRKIAAGLSEQPTSALNLATRPINQALIAAQDLGNIGNPDVDKSQYATIPAITPEDVVGSGSQFEEEHPIQSTIARVGGDLAPTIGIYAASQGLPIGPRMAFLAGYFGLSNIGKQIGDKQKQQDLLEPNPGVATGGLPDLLPENPAETITAGLLGGAGELIVPAGETAASFMKALPAIAKDGPSSLAQVPGLISRTFMDKVASDPATVIARETAAALARGTEQGTLARGKMGAFVLEKEGELALSKQRYKKAENRLFYKDIKEDEKILIKNLIEAYHETNYLADAGIAGGDSELIQNLLSKSLKEGADVGDYAVMRDLMDAKVINPLDHRFQKLTPDQVLDLITYHAEKFGLSSQITRSAMSDLRVYGAKVKNLEGVVNEAKGFLPDASSKSFLEGLSGSQRSIIGEPIGGKLKGSGEAAFKESLDRENGIDVINKFMKANDVAGARKTLSSLVRKTKMGLESSLDNFPVSAQADDWGKAVQDIRTVGEDFLANTLGKDADLDALRQTKEAFNSTLNESMMKFENRWGLDEINLMKEKMTALEEQVAKKQELAAIPKKGMAPDAKKDLIESQKFNKQMIKDLQGSIKEGLFNVDSKVPTGWTQDQYNIIQTELDDALNLAEHGKDFKSIQDATKKFDKLSRRLDATMGLPVKGPGGKAKPDMLDVYDAEAKAGLERIDIATDATYLKGQVGKDPASLSLAINSFWKHGGDLLKNMQNKSLSLKQKLVKGGEIVNSFYEDASYVAASNIMHPTDMMNFARNTGMKGAEGIHGALEGFVINSHVENASYIGLFDEAKNLGALPGTKKGDLFGKILNKTPKDWLKKSLGEEGGIKRYLENPDRLVSELQALKGNLDLPSIPLTQEDVRHLASAATALQRIAKKDGLDFFSMKTDGYLMHLADDKTQIYSLSETLANRIAKSFNVSSEYIEKNLFKPYMEKNFGILEKNKNLSYDYVTSMKARIGLSIYKRNTEALLGYYARVLEGKVVDPKLQAPMWSVIQQLAGKQSSSILEKEVKSGINQAISNATKNILNTEAFAFLDLTQILLPYSHFATNKAGLESTYKIVSNPKLLEKGIKALKLTGAYQGSAADDVAASMVGIKGSGGPPGAIESMANEFASAMNPDIRKFAETMTNHPFIEGPEFILKTLTGLGALGDKYGAQTEAVLDAIILKSEKSFSTLPTKAIQFGKAIKPGKQQAVTASRGLTEATPLSLVGDVEGRSLGQYDVLFSDATKQIFNAYDRYLFVKSPMNSLLGSASTIGKFSTFAGRSLALLTDMAINNPRALQFFVAGAYSLGGVQAITPLMNNINWATRTATGEDWISGIDMLESQQSIAQGKVSGPASFLGQLERMTNLGQGSRMSSDFAGPFPIQTRFFKDLKNFQEGNYTPLETAAFLSTWGLGKSFSVIAPTRAKELVKQFIGDPTSGREAERISGIEKDTTLVYGSDPSRREEITFDNWTDSVAQYLKVGRQPIIFRSYVDGVGQVRSYAKDLAATEIDLEKAYDSGDENLIRRMEIKKQQLEDKVNTEKFRLVDSFTPFYKEGAPALEANLDKKIGTAKTAIFNDQRDAVNDRINAIEYKLENIESLSLQETQGLTDKLGELKQLKRILYSKPGSYDRSEELQKKKRQEMIRF